MKYEMAKDEYFILKEFIDRNDLNIKIVSVVMDEQLHKLGFTEKIVCVVELDATDEAIEEASDIAMGYEIDAFNTPDGGFPPSENKSYMLYKKYGWIWDLFNGEHWRSIE